ELELLAHKSSPGGEHFTFDQKYNGLAVFNSQVKINLGKDGKVYSIFDNSYPTGSWPMDTLTADAEVFNGISLAEILATYTGFTKASIEEKTVIAVIDGKPATYKLLRL